LWGGVECTVNRVGDRYFDQLARCGHSARLADVEAIAALGLTAIRYPVLWERTAPDGLDAAEWTWADVRLQLLRERGVEPVVGLLHHGSGPRSTSLTDPGFADALAAYAAAVARRYPWVRRWTPVNEPLTTARFSTLYGHWYPHERDDRSFARALINQCTGIVRAMRAIRREIPGAQLVQTEDLGRTYGTPMLRDQVEFDNERRWLTFDLLCGRVDRSHPLWGYLRYGGISEHELDTLRDEACAPDLVGINHYITSERWLDERLERYTPATHGGNGRQRYADVEAVRVLSEGTAGAVGVLSEAWARYGLPLAVTEAHLGGAREQQLRWLLEVWQAAQALRSCGADIRAVTVWSLLGAHDWHNLVTRDEGRYEPGAFDVRAPRPRPTALARMVRDLALTGTHAHPVLDTTGWWRCDDRLLHSAPRGRARRAPAEPAARALLVAGATGTLGQAFGQICAERQLAHRLVRREEMEMSDASSVAHMLDAVRPWAVVNAAGFVRVDDAEFEDAACHRDNVAAPGVLAEACARHGIPLLTFSSDLVFDGDTEEPYVETAAPAPLNAYGRSKAEAELRVLAALPNALVVRTSAFFGPWDEHNFVTGTLRALRSGLPVEAASDQVVSPTYVPDLVHAALDLLIDGESGVWHLANRGAVTWAELAQRAAELAGLDPTLIVARPTSELGFAAPRPTYSVLGSERGAIMPSLDDALPRYVAARFPVEPAMADQQLHR
jgi:dTDP-4-dehydrorhamnose reductase